MVRSLLFDDVREQRFQDLVFSNLRSMLKARLIAKRPMNYVDATNLTPQERQHWIKLAKDYHYEVHAVFFDVPLEVCIERHQRRDRVVPEDVMRRMAAKLKPPAFEEGFAKITVVRVKKKESALTLFSEAQAYYCQPERSEEYSLQLAQAELPLRAKPRRSLASLGNQSRMGEKTTALGLIPSNAATIP